MSVFRPGETCWHVARAGRAAFLVDNQAYYTALFEALRAARRSILILGWAFDPRTRLAPDGSEGPADPDEVGRILVDLAQSRPDLDVRLLVWKSTLGINGGLPFFPHRAKAWFAHTRVTFREADDVPFGACHHQKVVVIDDKVAFCGGGDIVTNRWDTMAHLHREPRRILPDRALHAPRHEVTMLVDGGAAEALGELFRTRWRNATHETLPAPSKGDGDPWPGCAPPQLRDVEVAIARTEPKWRGRPLVAEVRDLTLACIASAKQSIYLENQYFTSVAVMLALAERLAAPEGPEVVLIVTGRAPSWFDHLAMDQARNPMIRSLREADRFGRFRAFAPRTPEGRDIVVHAKVSVFDDAIVRVGSANLNNRSGGFDTECELGVQGVDEATRAALAAFRDGLLSHFLGVTPTHLAQAHRDRGSLVRAIDTLNRRERLVPVATGQPTWWEELVSAGRFGDPSDVDESWRLRSLRRRPRP